jgi:hypothetical protein
VLRGMVGALSLKDDTVVDVPSLAVSGQTEPAGRTLCRLPGHILGIETDDVAPVVLCVFS